MTGFLNPKSSEYYHHSCRALPICFIPTAVPVGRNVENRGLKRPSRSYRPPNQRLADGQRLNDSQCFDDRDPTNRQGDTYRQHVTDRQRHTAGQAWPIRSA